MSTKETIVCASINDHMESFHIYGECFDEEPNVYIEYMFNHERGQTVADLVISRPMWEALVAEILKRGKP